MFNLDYQEEDEVEDVIELFTKITGNAWLWYEKRSESNKLGIGGNDQWGS